MGWKCLHVSRESGCAGISVNLAEWSGATLLPPFVQGKARTLFSTGDTGLSSLGLPRRVQLGTKHKQKMMAHSLQLHSQYFYGTLDSTAWSSECQSLSGLTGGFFCELLPLL